MADPMDVEDGLTPASIDKYKTAAGIANQVLAKLVAECQPNVRIAELCLLGDRLITEALGTVFNKDKKMDKGVAFPTCVSRNNVVGHFCPLPSDLSVLEEGDVVKIDLGVQIDGFTAVVGHTAVATADPAVAVSGRRADAVCAAHFAAEAALRLLRPGKKNTDVTEAIAKIAESFKCQPVEGVVSHQMKRFVIDANKTIANRASTPGQPSSSPAVSEITFEEGEVYAIDIVMSTGEGKVFEGDVKTTIYKRAVDHTYSLKLKAARALLSEATKRFSTYPFTIRNLQLDERQVKLGLTECTKHQLLEPYPVLLEKEGEFVAQMKFTALILPSSIDKITSHPPPNVSSELQITDPKIQEVLALGLKRSKKNKKKKKAAPAAAAGAAEPVTMEE
jgi:curved DNA binding protein